MCDGVSCVTGCRVWRGVVCDGVSCVTGCRVWRGVMCDGVSCVTGCRVSCGRRSGRCVRTTSATTSAWTCTTRTASVVPSPSCPAWSSPSSPVRDQLNGHQGYVHQRLCSPGSMIFFRSVSLGPKGACY